MYIYILYKIYKTQKTLSARQTKRRPNFWAAFCRAQNRDGAFICAQYPVRFLRYFPYRACTAGKTLAKIQNGVLTVSQNGRHARGRQIEIFGLRLLIKVLGGVYQKHENQNSKSGLAFSESAFLEFQSLILKNPFGSFSR